MKITPIGTGFIPFSPFVQPFLSKDTRKDITEVAATILGIDVATIDSRRNGLSLHYFGCMKLSGLVILLITTTQLYSQKLYSVEYPSQSDLKVFVVDYESQCDLKVFKVDYPSQVDGNQGLWHFVDYPSQSDFKIYFVDYESQSDLKIYFVKYQSQAGWRDKSKQHLLY